MIFHHKKSQTEIAGLIFIMIIITIALYFIVSLKTTPTSNKPVVVSAQLKDVSKNFILTLIKTSSSCGQPLTDYITDCSLGLGKLVCEGKDSCHYLNETIKTILDQTLNERNMKYELNISYKDETITYYNQECGPEMEKPSVGIQPVTLYPYAKDTALITLGVCY